jgi:methionyl-tRNA synthetase
LVAKPVTLYVWWDALANYVTALGYGTDDIASGEP